MENYERYCPHCSEFVKTRTFYDHRKQFFDDDSNTWSKKRKLAVTDRVVSTRTLQIDSHSELDKDLEVPRSPYQQSADANVGEDEGAEAESEELQLSPCEGGLPASTDSMGQAQCCNEDETDDDCWEEDSESEEDSADTDVNDEDEVKQHALDLITWITTFLLFWQSAFNISGRAIASLLAFLGQFFVVLARVTTFPLVIVVARLFPTTLYRANKYLGISMQSFTLYAVCGHCYSIYKLHQGAPVDDDGAVVPRRCSKLAFPNHKHINRRIPCNAPLFRKVILSHGRFKYYQINTYAFKSLKDALQRLLLRKGHSKMMEAWRQRHIPEGYLCDVYDGSLFHENQDFFSQSRSIGLMLNLDWFQPFDHSMDSFGAIYLTILNLPRDERFRTKNVILVGVLPAMEHEPSNVNSFLNPFVQEMKDLQKGQRFYTAESLRYKLTFHARLFCAACDIPAGRKLCGFKGHSANLGCSRCLKFFPGEVGRKNYSGFNRDEWPVRNVTAHRQHSKSILNAPTASYQKSLETANGIKYSVLLELDYFNPIRFNIIDPMHNLFLGTAKTMLRDVWLKRGIISLMQLETIQARVNSVTVPPNIGKTPNKLASTFAGFTAEQWKNWTYIYSLFALREILPTAHYRCWEAFVLACRLLCSTCISLEELQKADLLLLHFCRKVQELYGESAVTPNMHLHCHLRECVLDYGPIYSFWLFSFERYNGILGNFPTNKKSIEIQLMRQFEKEQNLLNASFPKSFSDDFSALLQSIHYHKASKDHEGSLDTAFIISARSSPASVMAWPKDTTQFCTFPKMSATKMLSQDEKQCLLSVYHIMYPALNLSSEIIPRSITVYTSCFLGSEKFGSAATYRSRKYSFVLASHLSMTSVDYEPGQIQTIFTHQFHFNDHFYTNTFCEIMWYKEHEHRFQYGKALQVFYKTFGTKTFLPLPRVFSKFAPAFGNLHGCDEHVMFVCPLSRRIVM